MRFGGMDMLYLFFACIAVGMILLAVFLRLRVTEQRLKAVVIKAVVSVFFLLTLLTGALAAGENADWMYTALIGGGLMFGLLGDIWLDLKYIYTQDTDFWTFAGFFSFMVGHVFYVVAMVRQFGFHPLALVGCVIAVAGAFAFIYLTEKPMKMHYGKFKFITALYGGFLFVMFVYGLNMAILGDHGNGGLILLCIGGLFFIISDLILSGTYFGEGKNRPVDVITNHVTYYIAQYCIASSALLIGMNF